MERISRTAFQGIGNIVRFNWHYYVFSFAAIIALFIANHFTPYAMGIVAKFLLVSIALSMISSLAVSCYIYDFSNFYSLNWLKSKYRGATGHLLNINAGFDETSWILKEKFPESTLTVFDFYDPAKHTEVSIERARKAYEKYPGTKAISTQNIPLPANSVDAIFLIFAAHEIRNNQEQIDLFKQLRLALIPGGQIIVVEHLRDWRNFFAYNIGYFHFFSKNSWNQTFTEAGFSEPDELKINPFVSIFSLTKDGATT